MNPIESIPYSDQIGFPLLSLICYFPLIGVLILILGRGLNNNAIRWVANLVAFGDLLLSLLIIPKFITDRHAMQFVENVPWIESINARYHFGIDGISVLLILMTTFLGFIAINSSWSAIQTRVREYYVFMLLLQTGMLGVFMALDFLLFYVFWEVMLVPMYFLIGIWGGGRKLYAAIKFFLYTLFGSVLLLLAILYLYFTNDTFQILDLYEAGASYALGVQILLFLALFVGFAIKVPMFPFHTWLPDAHVDAPTAGSVILAGVLLKMGTYGFLRIALPILPGATWWFLGFGPENSHSYSWGFGLAIFGVIYGALVCMMQKDMKRLVAYSSVSHMGFLMVGLFALNQQGIEGGILQMINHGLSTGALFLLVGILYERRHTRMIADFGGISKVMPMFAVVFLIITLSSIGMPTLNGFVGEILILIGAFQVSKWVAVLTATGIVLGAAYMLWMYQRVMFGEITKEENKGLLDLNFRELATSLSIIFFCFWIGLYPKPWLGMISESVTHTVNLMERNRPAQAASVPGFARFPAEPPPVENSASQEAREADSRQDPLRIAAQLEDESL